MRATCRTAPASAFKGVAQTAVVAGCAQLGERVADLVVVLLEVAAALVGESGELAATLACDGDVALVLEQGQCGVDRAGAGAPGAVRPSGHLLHELVAVHRLVGEQQQDGAADVTATGSAAAAAGPPTSPGPMTSPGRSGPMPGGSW